MQILKTAEELQPFFDENDFGLFLKLENITIDFEIYGIEVDVFMCKNVNCRKEVTIKARDFAIEGCLFHDKLTIRDAKSINTTGRNKESWTTFSSTVNIIALEKGPITLSHLIIKDSIIIDGCEPKSIQISRETKWEENAELWIGNSDIEEDFSMDYLGLFHNITINNCNLMGNINLMGIEANQLNITNCIVKKKILLNELTTKCLCLSNIQEYTLLSFNYAKTEILGLQAIFDNGRISLDGFEAKKCDNIEAANYIKHLALTNDSIITAIRFRKMELDLLYKETPWRKVGQKFMLGLNKISNNYGLSWERGILFTVCTSLLFLGLIIICGGLDGEVSGLVLFTKQPELLLSAFVDMVYIFNFPDTIANIELTPIGNFIYFISKIFVSYGIYQTVAAFRKYGQ